MENIIQLEHTNFDPHPLTKIQLPFQETIGLGTALHTTEHFMFHVHVELWPLMTQLTPRPMEALKNSPI